MYFEIDDGDDKQMRARIVYSNDNESCVEIELFSDEGHYIGGNLVDNQLDKLTMAFEKIKEARDTKLLNDKESTMMLPGEKEALLKVLEYADQYGYGNIISLLRRKWADKLMAEQGIPEKYAEEATNLLPYPKGFKEV